jgi:catechol 2,3-dioxygenase-like lactoylglutathione lyase family enzyme
MIDHMTFRVSDLDRTVRFYSAALIPLGYAKLVDEDFGGGRVVGFGKDGKLDTWFVAAPEPTTGCHLAWHASSRAEVDAFYAGAMASGGKDNGVPGPRPHYHEHYYGAFVIDPDGNNVEAVCHEPV